MDEEWEDKLNIWWGKKYFSTSYDYHWNILEGITKSKDKEFWIVDNEEVGKWLEEDFPEVGIYNGSVALEEGSDIWIWDMKFNVEVVKMPSMGTVLKCKRVGKILKVFVV